MTQDDEWERPSEQSPAAGPAGQPGGGPLPRRPVGPWDDYGRHVTYPMATEPWPADEHRPREGRRPRGWVWPAMAALALVVGLLGGVAGGALWGQVADGGAPTPYTGGLEDVDIVEKPPVKTGGVAAVAQELLPSTVQIMSGQGGPTGGATGSGFVLDKQGHIVTNNHVIASAAENDVPITVIDHEGNRYQADIVGRSPTYDLALLVVEGADLEPAALGSSEQLRVGDGVVAFGAPLGLSSTVTAGIVSALSRPVTTGSPGDGNSYINAVQTDAAINPGNSGGPLVNLRGQVVGVNSAIATNGGTTFDRDAGNIGVGFAIPIRQVRITADQILKTGEARYPIIGAQVRTGGLGAGGAGDGAELVEVEPGSPAEEAGLEAGDVVTEVGGERVADGIGLIVAIRSYQPRQEVEFTYLRDGEQQSAQIQLGSEVG